MGIFASVLGSSSEVCSGTYGDVTTENGDTTKGLQLKCPDGNDYIIPGDKDTAEQKAKSEVLRPNCDADEPRCEEKWRAQVYDETK